MKENLEKIENSYSPYSEFKTSSIVKMKMDKNLLSKC